MNGFLCERYVGTLPDLSMRAHKKTWLVDVSQVVERSLRRGAWADYRGRVPIAKRLASEANVCQAAIAS
jgi:hypothetical protein